MGVCYRQGMLKAPKPPRTEHERKFLVIVPDLPEDLPEPKRLVQGYLTYEPLQSRIRITDGARALHEFKGKDDLEIPTGKVTVEEAEFLLEHYRQGYRVEKLRHVIEAGLEMEFDDGPKPLAWELDVFGGRNAPLHTVEIELPSMDTGIPEDLMPSWVGEEITDDRRFKNKNLSQRPFDSWSDAEKDKILKLMGL